jgi:outer membrane protein assembly factor BamB
MRCGIGFAGLALGALLLLSACASSGGQPSAEDEKMKQAVANVFANMNIDKIARDAAARANTDFTPSPHDNSVRWQVYASLLKHSDLTGLMLVEPDKLLISIDGANPRLLNANKGTLLWELKTLRYDESELGKSKESGKTPPVTYPSYACITTHKDMLLFRADGNKGSKVLAVETATGNKRWSVELERSGELIFIPFPSSEVLVAVQQDKSRATLTTLKLATGAVVGTSEIRYGSGTDQPPAPTTDDRALWLFYDGVVKLSAATGKTEWRRSDIMAGEQSPPMQLGKGRLYVLDGKNTLQVLDAHSGKTLASGKQRDAAVYTNLFPIGDRVYLRGVEKEKSGEPRFFVASVRSADAKELWADIDKETSVSNIIDENDAVYFATPYTVIALDREKGSRRFAVRASDIGKSFPVQIRKYGDRVVYIGELVIAAFDAKTGAKVYRHGFDPINQTAHMDALNEVIEKKQKFLSWFTGPWSDWDFKSLGMSEFYFQQSIQSQNQSNYLAQQGAQLARTANTVGDKTAAYRSEMKYTSSTIYSAFSRAEFSAGMAFMTVENIQKGVAAATAADRKQLLELLRIRKLLYAAYVVTQLGDYVYRPDKEGETVGLSVIHLPSGHTSYTELTPEYELIGVFSLVALDAGVVYHPWVQKKRYTDTYFVARPITIPK